MAWRIEFDPRAFRELSKLGKNPQRRIITYLRDRIAESKNPRRFGKGLKGDKRTLWRYRVGDYRIICDIRDNALLVLVIRVGHRRDIYK